MGTTAQKGHDWEEKGHDWNKLLTAPLPDGTCLPTLDDDGVDV